MKRFAWLFVVLIILLVASAGCFYVFTNTGNLSSGTYVMSDPSGQREIWEVPYIHFNVEDHTFCLSSHLLKSYCDVGWFYILGDTLRAKSETTTYVFQIKDSQTLVLVNPGDHEYFVFPEDAEFVFREL